MAEREGLLLAILTNPADDVHRLVYADWLDERGGEGERLLAEFIRLQIALEATAGEDCESCRRRRSGGGQSAGPCRCAPMRREQRRQEAELLLSHVPHSDAAGREGVALARCLWARACCVRGASWRFRRGFVHSVRLPLRSWLDHGSAMVREHPLQRVSIADAASGPGPGWGPLGDDHEWVPAQPFLFTRDPNELPVEVFRLLEGGEPCAVSRRYESWTEADDALSSACLRWAKERMGPSSP